MTAPLRIASWNIACGAGERYRCKHLDAMIDVLAAAQCDIILLQEVDCNRTRSGQRDITAEIGAALGMHGIFAAAIAEDDGFYGNAVLSRAPFETSAALSLGPNLAHTGEKENRSAAYARITFGGQAVRVFSTHLAFTFEKPSPYRVAQVRRLKEEIDLSPALPVILGGDFNVPSTSPDLALFDGILTNLTPDIGPTCSLETGHVFAYDIDYICASGLTALHAEKRSFPELSDHCLILADAVFT